ncbi:MAG: GNAT family N-acetyltransferase [Nannocystaceae bacterium]
MAPGRGFTGSPPITSTCGNIGDIFDEPVRPARVAAYVAQSNHILLLAIREGQAVGQILGVIHHHPDKASELYIDDLAVDPAFQRQGIATQLINRLVDEGVRAGAETVWVAAEPDNRQATGLYKAIGLSHSTCLIFERALIGASS